MPAASEKRIPTKKTGAAAGKEGRRGGSQVPLLRRSIFNFGRIVTERTHASEAGRAAILLDICPKAFEGCHVGPQKSGTRNISIFVMELLEGFTR